MKNIAVITAGLLACAAYFVASPAFAGEMVEPVEPIAVEGGSLIDPITGAVSVGFDSTYFFRGSDYGRNAPWAEVDFSIPVGDFTLDLGAWYTNPTSPSGAIPFDDNDELDIYASVGTTLGPVDVFVGVVGYFYPEFGDDSTGEVTAGLGTSVAFLDLGFVYYYDWVLTTHTFEYSIGTSFDVTDFLALNVGVGLGHIGSDDFWGVVSGGLDVQLTDSATLSGYIAYNFVDTEDKFIGRRNGLFGGGSIAVSF